MPLAPDRPDLLPWSRGQPITADRLNRLQGAVLTDIQVVHPLLMTRKGNSVSIRLAEQPKPSPTIVALVKITGSAAGGGKYTGAYWDAPTTGAPATGNLTEAELGTTSTLIRIINVREVGTSTHDLSAASYLPLIFLGLYRGTAADGIPVYVIDGRQSEDCAS